MIPITTGVKTDLSKGGLAAFTNVAHIVHFAFGGAFGGLGDGFGFGDILVDIIKPVFTFAFGFLWD